MSETHKKIIWAVDPFSSDEKLLKSTAWCLRGLAKKGTTWVRPVTVWPQANLDLLSQYGPSLLKDIQKEGAAKLEGVLRRVNIPGIQSHQVQL